MVSVGSDDRDEIFEVKSVGSVVTFPSVDVER